MQFGLLAYKTDNLGDDIQSLATRALIPHPDHLIDRDRLAQFDAPNDVKLVCNGWYTHVASNWPPSPKIKPLLISMHFCQDVSVSGIAAARYFVSGENAEYLKHFGPVGARDLATLRVLEEAGVPAYFSGCMTLTLQRRGLEKRDDVVVLVDVSDEVVAYVRKHTRKQIRLLSAFVPGYAPERRTGAALDLLAQLETASCVVTTRLHAALPSLALETPVFLIDTADDQYRFDGLNNLVRHGPVEKFFGGEVFDVNNPEPNYGLHYDVASGLRTTVARFVESDDVKPSIDLPTSRLNAALASLMEAKKSVDTLTRENQELKARIAQLEASDGDASRSWWSKRAR